MRFNLILLQMLSSDPRIFLAQANANDGKLELQTSPFSLLWTPTAKCPRTIFFSLLPPPYSRNTRQLCRAGAPERAIHALLPPFSSLLPTPYFGRPLQSVHALFPPFSSLLPTLDAHCKVSTHFSLPSPPSSLLWTPTAKCPRTIFFSLLPPPYFGCPLQSVHALSSSLSSLLSTHH